MRILAAFAFLAATALTGPAAARPVDFAAEAPRSGTLVLPLRNADHLGHAEGVLDAGSRAMLARALESAKFDFGRNAAFVLREVGPWSKVVVIGTGDQPFDARTIQDWGGVAAAQTEGDPGPVTLLTQTVPGAGPDAAAQLAIGAGLGGYSFDKYKFVDPSEPRARDEAPLTIVTGNGSAEADYRRRGRALVEAVNFTRGLINEPANAIYPESFVERTRAAFQGVDGVRIEVLDVPAMERLGMGSILSVGKGSARPPRMMIVEYRGRGAPANPIVLAGKGITFDSGGISLKPGSGMWEMKGDMSGAAAVVGAALALARQQAPVNVVAIAALAENMPGGSATRPGDVVKAHNGRTIEVINTDAEGRLVLADALAYAETRYDPAAIVDLATLTGSKVTALGDKYAGLFSRHEALAEQIEASAEKTGELVWRLPLHPSYAKAVKSDIADYRNVGEGAPGASFGAQFIGSFANENTPWAHLDIAGNELGSSTGPTVPDGAAGYGVRLLDDFVRNFRPVPAEPAQR